VLPTFDGSTALVSVGVMTRRRSSGSFFNSP
jgi:hypothetical protein